MNFPAASSDPSRRRPSWMKPFFVTASLVRLRVGLLLSVVLTAGCQLAPKTGAPLARKGDEIVAAGQFFHIGTPVVLWMDPGGYDAYRVERRFSPIEKADWETSQAEVKGLTTPNRYGQRHDTLNSQQIERVRGGGWDLPLLQDVVDQFVLHFDVCGTSRQCFNILHDHRDLSVHFMLDVDGTIYQTLDLKERARHATIANNRSIGIEIANMGAYGVKAKNPFAEWYRTDTNGQTVMTIPTRLDFSRFSEKGILLRPDRLEPVRGTVQGEDLLQYDYTPQQYEALIKLTAALCKVFPRINCDYPRDASGQLITRRLSDEGLAGFRGVLGHYHVQTNKVDPGPALQWDRVINGARKLLD
jgi:N-acetylmuramoyl-L-alanine amidase